MRVDFKVRKFCPHCKHETLQTYVVHHVYDEKQALWDGDCDTVDEPAAYFVFSCRDCCEVLLYHFQANDEFECEDLFPVTRGGVKTMNWNQEDISRRMELIWPQQAKKNPKQKAILDPSTPDTVRRCYETGLEVRPFSTDLYALQLRKTLEAVCHNLGASKQLPNGRRAMLWQQIDELGNRNLVGEFIAKAAHELKDISNTGAHYSDSKVTDSDIRKLENLLALITTYVYGSNDRRNANP